MLALAKKFNSFYLNRLGECKPFVIDGFQIGLVDKGVEYEMYKYHNIFHIYSDVILLNPKFSTYEERSNVIELILREWRSRDLFPKALRGWREECFEVKCGWDDPDLLRMERAATSLFGIRKYGVDINGYVNDSKRGLCMWLQKRSKTKQTWAGKLDNMVGGGLAVGYSILDTALKEAAEEASIPDDLLTKLVPVGTVSFFFESERGLFPNTEFVYDLELPPSFIPINQDGEVESFHLVTLEEIYKLVLSPEFKTTSCPVILDFLIRHGYLTTDTEPDLPQLQELLHVPLHTLYRRVDQK
jgi:8-oxo-dGTP pyrophosphatase MutT (NUDIX family)